MARRRLVASTLVFFVVLLLPSPALAQPRFDFDATPGSLSKDVVPSRYQLSLDVDPGRPDFTGEATIDVRVRRAVPSIGLHALDLSAISAVLVGADGSRLPLVVKTVPGPVGWRLETDPPAAIPAGDYALRIAYAGKVQVPAQGLYAVPYKVGDRPATMLATQLEAIDARRLFPCFDEPSFRASFEISVSAPSVYEVVSNMPIASKTTGARSVVHRFQPTPPMPTYLVAIAVGRLDSLAGKAGGVPLRILTVQGRREKARYALSVTRQVIPFYTEYFGVPFALPKLDQLAVPGVRNGAMEDWGLISYSENVLLFDPATSSPETRRGVFAVISHEVAHQWFGDLVTAASWEEIWLNEAFANWMEEKAMARFHPEWRVDLSSRLGIESVMERDAGPSSRPIRSGPVIESAVGDVFDGITYAKGSAVLSMLEQWIGPAPFRAGIAAYVRDRRLSNATAGDLWHHLSKASGKDVARVAASWTDQAGFPLVQASTRCVDGRTLVTLRQERFSLGSASLPPQTWRIPIQLSRGNTRATLLLEEPEQTFPLPGCTREPVIANGGGIGYYRVEYGATDIERLAKAFARLRQADRVTLLGDTFALAQAGRAPMASYFSLLAALPTVRDGSRGKLHSMAFLALGFLDDAMAGTPAQARVRSAARALLAPALADLGWEPKPGEAAEDVRLRGSLIRMLARFDDASVAERSRQLFDEDVAGKRPLPTSTRSAVIHAVGIHADQARFDRLVALLKSAQGEEDRRMYARALAAGRDPGHARELLVVSLSGDLPPNVASSLAGWMGETSPNAPLAYEFTLERFGDLARLSGTNLGESAWLLPSAAWSLNEVSWAQRLVEDQQAKAGPDGAAAAQEAAARIKLLAFVRERDAAALAEFLAGWSPRS